MTVTAERGQLTAEEIDGLGWRRHWSGPTGAQHLGSALHPAEGLALDEGRAWLQEQGR
ncbi:hypothetical protein [Mycolicibacterium iranicum]|uniref:Uncharacterized protein n=1 Tax=Mycolicibacterium iranicum TaxID=912594 RepID=A0ABT4HJU4_MYCIR|nr:hypothetical protein [Mycolicibacterium iranicum]MCZ0730478.1 hypothetical protein [Mycolicibacterium iranicum]